MKKSIFTLTIVLILCLCMSVSAAPYSVSGTDIGDDSSVLIITNPQYTAVTVHSGELVISGYCKSGAIVNVYKLAPSGDYEITNYQMEIGASGIFFQKLAVAPGRNSFIIRAQMPDGRYQQVKLDALYFAGSFIDYIKTF